MSYGLVFAVPRLFTPEIARFYEDYYTKKGIQFRKGDVLSSTECDDSGKVPLPLTSTGTMFLFLVNRGRGHHVYIKLYIAFSFVIMYISNKRCYNVFQNSVNNVTLSLQFILMIDAAL